MLTGSRPIWRLWTCRRSGWTVSLPPTGGGCGLGATATIDSVRRCELLPDSVRALARAEQPSTLRTLATVGGLVAKGSSPRACCWPGCWPTRVGSSWLDPAAAGADSGPSERGLGKLLAAGLPAGALVTAVTVDPSGNTAVARTGRTPADVPIVAAYGRRIEGFVSMALTGVADHPVLVDVFDPAAGLDPPGDFRGSRDYRLHLAHTLTARVMQELSG